MEKQKKNSNKQFKNNFKQLSCNEDFSKNTKKAERNFLRNSTGITLIALVISIIVMLILAGVSINAVVGDNGILRQAQTATVKSRYASYLEEFELNKAGAMIEQGLDADLAVNILGTEPEFLDFVPSILDDDKPKFEIMAGYLVYTGGDTFEEEVAKSTGMFSGFDQELYDIIGREFEMYILAVEEAKANGSMSSIVGLRQATFEQINNCLGSGKKIPVKYQNDFILSSGTLAYTGTNEERLILLSTSSTLAQYIRPTTGEPKLLLLNYVSPVGGNIASTTTQNTKTVYKVKTNDNNYWTVRIDSQSGSIRYGTIINYEGVGGTITIPDRLEIESVGLVNITSIEGKSSGSGATKTYVHNIFINDSGTNTVSTDIVQVIVAKGVYQIKDYALANIGNNKPFTILHDGADLDLDYGTGIENTCGTYTFVAPTDGIYTLKCWGASGAGWDKVNAESHDWGSDAGYGGYSEGTVSLAQGEKLYVNIGGKGLAAHEILPEASTLGTSNGSGGCNGGGNLPRSAVASSSANNAGGGCTDIRFGGSTYDYQILVAGGGGGCDDFSIDGVTASGQGKWGRNKAYAPNDGSGGAGGGTTHATDKTKWSGGAGYIDGILWDEEFIRAESSAQAANTGDFLLWSKGKSLPGTWKLEGNVYVPSGNARLVGADSVTGSNYGAAGGGYYGGINAYHREGGGGGGSAYADIEGTIKQVSNIKGYVDLEEVGRTMTNGEPAMGAMLNSEIPSVTYYGRTKPALTYGNGLVEISKN